MQLKPLPDQFGEAVFQVVATDLGGLTVTNTFTVTVHPIDDSPMRLVLGRDTLSGFRLKLHGTANNPVAVDRSFDLFAWDALGLFNLDAQGQLELPLALLEGEPVIYYRARVSE